MKYFLLGILFIPLLAFGEGRTESRQNQPALEAYRDETGSGDADENSEWTRKREQLVEGTIESRAVNDEGALEAMRKVPRHEFVPRDKRKLAYTDQPLPIGFGQTISQPYIVAYMTKVLEVGPGDRVLEIGTGSGYQAAVLSELADQVYTIEIIDELAESARDRLKTLGYDNVWVKNGDGYYGWEEKAPFDGIIVTAAAGHVPPPLIQQLKPGGRIVIPVGGVYQVQQLTLLEKREDGTVSSNQLMAVRFVPFTGAAQNSDSE
jgi:protein-L-isoaspartate(D-aspartate) O-methyltransferase